MPKKKVLITGCSGYIGSHLCKLLDNDYDIYGVDIVEPKYPIKNFYRYDITKNMNILHHKFDAVVHLAALVNVSESEKIPTSYYNTNLFGTINIIEKIITKNFIYASTGAAEFCNSAYATSKKAAEDVIKEFHKNIPYTIFRFYNVIGTSGYPPTNKDGLMYNLMQSEFTRKFTIFGNDYDTKDGTCVRDYVHVDEICEAIKMAIENPANKIECLGHGVGYSVAEMFKMFLEINEDKLYKTNNEAIIATVKNRRKGDIPVSVLEEISPYMKQLYTIEQLLTLLKSRNIKGCRSGC